MGVRSTNVTTVTNNVTDNQRTNIHELRRIKAAIEKLILAISGGNATLAEQQLQTAELIDINSALSAALNTANSPSHEAILNPSNQAITGFKEVSFVCSGTITVTLDGNTIVYPYTLGASTILGSTIKADTISTNSITFNGAGTVLVTIQQ